MGRLRLEWVTPAMHNEAWKVFENYSDQDFSFVDCTSFVIAKQRGPKEVFGFDDHFKTSAAATTCSMAAAADSSFKYRSMSAPLKI